MGISCVSIVAWQSVTLGQADPTGQVADGFDSGSCGGKQNTIFFNKSFPEALQSTGTFALVQPHAAQNTPSVL